MSRKRGGAFRCGLCPHHRDLKAAQKAGDRVPKRSGHFTHPIECRLRPVPVFHPGFEVETFAVLDADDPGCSEGRAAAAKNSPAAPESEAA